ncbi:MAG: UDP-2,4-diacetamido-2,4,6-trideoxy-beta-L-altropyranose hydrolase [Rhodospirillales bacterium]|nr:UDP-2,4-diacetamido-2,4,6-trideoxy-beta-L-altropyranose hydrolase [Rhodospirillales bacterium]
MPSALFRFDASPKIGGGHAFRSGALARAMAEQNWDITLAVGPDTLASMPALKSTPSKIIELPSSTGMQIESLKKCAHQYLLVVDHYELNADFEMAASEFCDRVLVIDDLANRPHQCDFLLDQTLGRQPEDYAPWVPPTCTLMLGPTYALLRPQFAIARATMSKSLKNTGALKNVLISMGASDPFNITSLALRAIELTNLPISTTVVLGPAFDFSDDVQNVASQMTHPVKVLENVSNMAELMTDTDLSIGAGGITSWERCCLGLPSLLVVTADNQNAISLALEKAGAAQVIGYARSVSAPDICQVILNLHKNADQLVNMSKNGMAICDGRGTTRVIEALAT